MHFSSEVLQAMMERLESGDKFWKELVKVRFPTLPECLFFDQDGQIPRHFWNDDGTHKRTIVAGENSDEEQSENLDGNSVLGFGNLHRDRDAEEGELNEVIYMED